MGRWIEEMKGLVWTLAGTALVLITLSGDTRTTALWISGVALAANIFAIIVSDSDD